MNNYLKYIYLDYLCYHWVDLVSMIQDNYEHELGPKDSVVVGACARYSLDTLKESYSAADKYIVYQLEPLYDEHWHPVSKIVSNMQGADEVWDYDLDNIEILKSYGIDAKFKPFLYSKKLKRIENKDDLDIDILFYGSLTDDRLKVLSDIFNWSNSSERLAIIFNFDGEKLDEYISRAKIIVDLQTNIEVPNIQKQTRIFYALINDKCVVSEKSRRNYYGNLIIEAERDNIASTIFKVLREGIWKTHSNKLSEQFEFYTRGYFTGGKLA